MPISDIDSHYANLTTILQATGRLAIAFSGGVDSVFLLKAAVEAKTAAQVLAITAKAENFPESELREATDFARELGVEHLVLEYDILSVPEFVRNDPDRCYHCKKALFGAILAVAEKNGCGTVADGANRDDIGDYRPGTQAARELGVVSPLQQAGLGKKEIRALLQRFAIPFWNKPSFACLASRIPYGIPITGNDLHQVEQAERFFMRLGVHTIRVRHHGTLARIEVDAADRARFFEEDLWERVATELERLGYAYSALDLRGYRTGSLNAVLPDG